MLWNCIISFLAAADGFFDPFFLIAVFLDFPTFFTAFVLTCFAFTPLTTFALPFLTFFTVLGLTFFLTVFALVFFFPAPVKE